MYVVQSGPLVSADDVERRVPNPTTEPTPTAFKALNAHRWCLVSCPGGAAEQLSYRADLDFLEQRVWPLIKGDYIAHDAYSCDVSPAARAYPTRRPDGYVPPA